LSEFHSRRHPPTAFLRPSRASLIQYHRLVSCGSRSSGFDSPRLLPFRELYPARHPAIPSRRFPASFRHRPKTMVWATGRAPRAFCPRKVRVPSWEYCIPRRPVAPLSFVALTAFGALDWCHVPMTHPPMASTCRAFSLAPHADLRRLPSRARASLILMSAFRPSVFGLSSRLPKQSVRVGPG